MGCSWANVITITLPPNGIRLLIRSFFGDGSPNDSLDEVVQFLPLLPFLFQQIPLSHYQLPDATTLPVLADQSNKQTNKQTNNGVSTSNILVRKSEGGPLIYSKTGTKFETLKWPDSLTHMVNLRTLIAPDTALPVAVHCSSLSGVVPVSVCTNFASTPLDLSWLS
jgi:hypothetical protein